MMFDLTDGVWRVVWFACLIVVKQRSFFPLQSGWCQGKFASASYRNTSALGGASPHCSFWPMLSKKGLRDGLNDDSCW